MRYLELSNDFPPDPAYGAGIHVGGLVEGMLAAGDSAMVVTRNPGGPSHELLHDGRLEVIRGAGRRDSDESRMDRGRFDPSRFIVDRLTYNHDMLAVLNDRDVQVDVIHNHSTGTVPLACELSLVHDVPLVTTVHVLDALVERSGVTRPPWLDRHVIRALEAEGYKRSKLIVAPSKTVAQMLDEEYPWCTDRVEVLEHPSTHAPQVKESYAVSEPARVMVVGRLDPYKGLEQVISALGRLPSGTVECWLVGEGIIRTQLSAMAEEAGVQVRFLGKLPHEEVLRTYHAADVLIAPSVVETYGLVLQEAMNAGLPVVAADIPAFAERVHHGVNGLLVPIVAGPDGTGPRVEATAEAVGKLLSSETIRRNLGRAAHAHHTLTTREYAERLNKLVSKYC